MKQQINSSNPSTIFLSIRWKLYILVVIATCLVALMMLGLIQWNFDRGFLKYINQQDKNQLEQIIPELTRYYQQSNSWQPLVDQPQHWAELLIKALNPTRRESRPPIPIHRPRFRAFLRRYVLLNEEQQLLIGHVPKQAVPLTLPIEINNQLVGHVGVIPRKELTDFNDIAFAESQRQLLLIFTGIVIALSALLSIPLAGSIVKPIQKLRTAMNTLASQKQAATLEIKQHDEIGLLAADFNQLSNILEHQEHLRRQWLADIAHELRTPISVLQAELEAIEDGIRPLTLNSIQSLQDDLGRLTRLVNDLHHLAQEDTGAIDYHLSSQPLQPILEKLVKRHTPLLEKHQLSISINDQCIKPIALKIDADRIQQLFINLLFNSLHYTDSPGQIHVSLKTLDHNLTVTWEDSAPEVPKNSLPYLFDRLYRVDTSRQRVKGGAGLGLAIVKAICEAHQAQVTAQQSSLGGLKLIINFPLSSNTKT
ncbi:ATP-binding protein [Zooshikella harenae]|uniref:histidine kinase n=1 Tax=Zooshikella harenae TaxID=2827238 RepID=A0ABS5ZAJ6_9GAMM|nr:ATP-binding protein [Zooshikella harenae]MBU2710295.1 HAMP domain-containing protein [Zooshikella harenae]